MNAAAESGTAMKSGRVNLRTPEVMEAVQAQVERHFRSVLVEEARAGGGELRRGRVRIRLAKEFGFCYGVERAIDLAYAAAKVFAGRRLFIVGEIIHNPDVNEQIAQLGIRNLVKEGGRLDLEGLGEEDVVILPAFGAEVGVIEEIRKRGCQIVDTTCGDVMSVWKRVRQNAREEVTSIIHGKAWHEETRATASRARESGSGHYLVVLDLEQTRKVCDYIRGGGDREEFLQFFAGAYSEGFDPDRDLRRVGVANQTTMLRGETEAVQRLLLEAIKDRDGGEPGNFRFFDTICGATQERQDALFEMLARPPQVLIVVGGYNSSNTAHLVEIGERACPAYFVRDHRCLESADVIRHFSLEERQEITSTGWLPGGDCEVGVTAGASCPNNLIEDVIRRVFEVAGEPL